MHRHRREAESAAKLRRCPEGLNDGTSWRPPLPLARELKVVRRRAGYGAQPDGGSVGLLAWRIPEYKMRIPVSARPSHSSLPQRAEISGLGTPGCANQAIRVWNSGTRRNFRL